ncbi:MAG: BspA family leucine-rich repeat surface protein [Clostridia bacterium]|nr:BspA family leucine-rich repeat surface protein [Clostridia bacterium]
MNCAQNVETNSYNAKGITLIALIITIVIMLILAGITLNLTLGENGIFQKAKLAKGQYETASAEEKLEMDLATCEMGGSIESTMEDYLRDAKLEGIAIERITKTSDNNEYIVELDDHIYVIYTAAWMNGKVKIFREDKGNVMKSDCDFTVRENDLWLNTGIARKDIKSISFVNEIPNNLEEETNKADVTALGHGEGKVMAWWTTDSNDASIYNITIGANGGVVAPKSCFYLFGAMPNLEEIDFGENAINFDTSNTIDMWAMFREGPLIDSNLVSRLEYLDLRGFNTSNVLCMNGMFAECRNLKGGSSENNQLDFSSFDTSNVINTGYMFHNCALLTNINLGDIFNKGNLEVTKNMFASCEELKSLELGSNFNTENVTDMAGMFWDCCKLEELNLGQKFYTENVTSMNNMFGYMQQITSLNLGNFGVNRANEITTTNMFHLFNPNCEITVKNQNVKDWLTTLCNATINIR